MPRFYLGADIRFAALAFGYTSVFAGLFMRFVMNGPFGYRVPAPGGVRPGYYRGSVYVPWVCSPFSCYVLVAHPEPKRSGCV